MLGFDDHQAARLGPGVGKGFAAQVLQHVDGELQVAVAVRTEVLGAHTHCHLRPDGGHRAGERDGHHDAAETGQLNVAQRPIGTAHQPVDKVHLWRADEARHKGVGRVVVHLQRRADLLNLARTQHHDLVGQGHRLDLVVGDVDDGGAQLAVQAGDFDAHVHAQFGIQVGQGFVKQKHFGVAHDGPANRHPLALAAGQSLGLAIHQRLQAENLGGGIHLGGHLGFGSPGKTQGEAHVLAHRHMRVQRVRLEHHGDAALGRVYVVDAHAANFQVAAGDVFQAGHHAQQGRFAAAGRADEDDEFAPVDLQVYAPDHVGVAKGFGDFSESDVCHFGFLTRQLR